MGDSRPDIELVTTVRLDIHCIATGSDACAQGRLAAFVVHVAPNRAGFGIIRRRGGGNGEQ